MPKATIPAARPSRASTAVTPACIPTDNDTITVAVATLPSARVYRALGGRLSTWRAVAHEYETEVRLPPPTAAAAE